MYGDQDFCTTSVLKKVSNVLPDDHTLYLRSILSVISTLFVSMSTRRKKSLSVSNFPWTKRGTGFNGFFIPGCLPYCSVKNRKNELFHKVLLE